MESTAEEVARPSVVEGRGKPRRMRVDKAGKESDNSDQHKDDDVSSLAQAMTVSRELELDLSKLNIIDLTDASSRELYEATLSKHDFEELMQQPNPPWREEPACRQLMDAPSADDLDSRDLCEVVRTPVIAARSYRRNVYYDLHAIEVIAGRWIDLMCSPRNHIALTCSERTSALDGALLLLQNLFTRFNDRISFKWIEVEAGATKRHKRDVTLSEVDGDGDKATVMLVEFADGFGKFDAVELKRDTGKIYRNAAWISQRTYRYSEENRYTLSAKYGLYLPTSHGPPPEIRSPSGPLVAFHSCQKRCC